MAARANEPPSFEHIRTRSRVLRTTAVVLFMIMVSRLGWLQIVRGTDYRKLSKDNYVQVSTVRAPRGLILDRNGEVLAENRAALSVILNRSIARDDEEAADVLSELLELDREFVAEKLADASTNYYGGTVLIDDVDLLDDRDFARISRLVEQRSRLKGIKVVETAARRYPEGTLATHAIGYVGEISDAELADMEASGYRPGSIVGKSGIEKRYEHYLNGRNGQEYWVYDASGRELYEFQLEPRVDAKPGHNFVLTIDAPAQRRAEEALAEFRAGAIVAIEPSTGEVLVMASHPSPDPNALVDGLSEVEWSELSGSPTHPLINRAIQAAYPPASTFKLITAAAGLQTGDVRPRREQVICKGAFKYGIRTFRCWRAEGHGLVDLMKGIVESCDVFFYQLGARLGVEKLMTWTARAGLGRKTGIEIVGEVRGNVPTPDWYDRRYGEGKWSRGVVINLAIGQGELLVTPIQAACLACAIANEGRVMTPHLFKQVQTYSGTVVGSARRSVAYDLPFAADDIAFLKRAMVNVVEAPNGTGKQARVPGIEVGGKTGTAQHPHGEGHAWFVSFAPADDPQIAIAVLVENAGSGGAIAAPIAREVTKAYLRIEDEPPPVAPRRQEIEPAGADSDEAGPEAAGPNEADADETGDGGGEPEGTEREGTDALAPDGAGTD